MRQFKIGEKYGVKYACGGYAYNSIQIIRRTDKTIFYKFIDGRADDAEHRAKINHFHNAEEGIDVNMDQYYAQGWGYIDEPKTEEGMNETEKKIAEVEFEIKQIEQNKQETEEMKQNAEKNKKQNDYEENIKNKMIHIYEKRAGIQHYIKIKTQRTEYSKINAYYMIYNDGWEEEAWIDTEICGGWDDLEEVQLTSARFDKILKLTQKVMQENYEKACELIEEHEEDIEILKNRINELNEKLENLKTPATTKPAAEPMAPAAEAVKDEIVIEAEPEKATDEADAVKEFTTGCGTTENRGPARGNEALIAAAKSAAGIDPEMVCHTYKKWQELGYQVMKGEKAKLKIELWHPSKYKNKDDEEEVKLYKKMTALFTAEQIQKIIPDELQILEIDFAL